jgi:hypothetical protein
MPTIDKGNPAVAPEGLVGLRRARPNAFGRTATIAGKETEVLGMMRVLGAAMIVVGVAGMWAVWRQCSWALARKRLRGRLMWLG